MSANYIKHKLKKDYRTSRGGGIQAHSCDTLCPYCKGFEKADQVEWTHQNCAACDAKLECLFQEGAKAMGKVVPTKLSLNLATMILKEMDPEGVLGLEPNLDMSTFQAPKPEEIIICDDLFEELPAAGAFLLCRDAVRKLVSLDEKGDPEMTYENTFWLDNSGRFRDAAFNIAMARWSKQYMGEDTIGASFRLIDDKVAVTFRPADEIDKAKMLLAKAMLKQANVKGVKTKRGLDDLLEDLLSR